VDGALRRSYDRIELILGVPNVVVEEIDRCSSIGKQTTRPLTQQVKLLTGWPTVGPAASAMETASANFSRRPHPGQTGTSQDRHIFLFVQNSPSASWRNGTNGQGYSLVLRLHSPVLPVHASVPPVQTQPRISVLSLRRPPNTAPVNPSLKH
jgi:hypothetical protein